MMIRRLPSAAGLYVGLGVSGALYNPQDSHLLHRPLNHDEQLPQCRVPGKEMVSPAIIVRPARRTDLESLTTIVARAFHPVNPYIRRCFPNTKIMRAWWHEVFAKQVDDPDCNILVAVATTEGDGDYAENDEQEPVQGVLCMSLQRPDARGAGLWTETALTEDHDVEACKPMFASMAGYREELMFGYQHYCLELLGVDHGSKGQRVGSQLLQRAEEIADQHALSVFVQANGSAKGFYQQFGFELKNQVTMPGDDKYEEHMLVRPVRIVETRT